MFGVCYTSSWTHCTGVEQCSPGTVCATWDGGWSEGFAECVDCQLIYKNPNSTSFVGSYEGEHASTIAYCEAQLEGGLASLLEVTDFSRCLYFQDYLKRTGMLDYLVRLGAFVIVSAAVAIERQEQCVAEYLRKVLQPLPSCCSLREGHRQTN